VRESVAAGFLVAAALAGGGFVLSHKESDDACGPGFRRSGARCCPGRGVADAEGVCGKTPAPCPDPLALDDIRGCVAPPRRVAIPAMKLTVGSSDWEADGAFPPRVLETAPFHIDAFEVTRVECNDTCRDMARAVSRLSLAEAKALCTERGGRLPSEDEWMAAALYDPTASEWVAKRYPWGDTGLVCRRAAWGLSASSDGAPCGHVAEGPDTVGAHPAGRSAAGLYDMAGNVAEWVVAATPRVKGGSWQSALAAELRVWAYRELSPESHEPWVGVRCAYP
jgi:formylglycine-generating enzyme required for sulfatase activity